MNRRQGADELIGLTGFARAGKSEVSSFLTESYGYNVIKPSSVVRAALRERYGERQFARSEYRTMSEELRSESGPGYYLDGIDYFAQRTAIDGTRHLDTARFIQQRGGFLIGLVARADERYRREQLASDGKPVSPSQEEFEAQERPEMNQHGHGNGGQILKVLCCVEPSHIIDTTEMSLAEVRASVTALLDSHDISPLPNNGF